MATMLTMLTWKAPTNPTEKVLQCCGCGSSISAAESRAAVIDARRGSAVHSCSPRCEEAFESANGELVERALKIAESAEDDYWSSPERSWNRKD